jgi:hypothetical protein
MPTVFLESQSSAGLAKQFKLLQSKHTQASTWHARQFASTLETSIGSLIKTQDNLLNKKVPYEQVRPTLNMTGSYYGPTAKTE